MKDKVYRKIEKFIKKYQDDSSAYECDYTIYDLEEFIEEIINIVRDKK